jgi:hypothetical protein
MGTNYYATRDVGRIENTYYKVVEELHIGKSSAGWCFGLHVIPERGLNSLYDWMVLLKNDDWHIVDEYGCEVPPDELFSAITYEDGDLVRHEIDGKRVIAHGEGTWDYIMGEFF